MAIVENFWLKNQRKRLAGAVIYQAMGQTRSRELAVSVSNPRTTAQMSTRVKWANLVNFYRANASWMKFAYETRKQNQSEYNKFMSLNVSPSRIYLPKPIANQGGCIVDAYRMTQGSLASVEFIRDNQGWQSNLYLVNSSEFDENVTVAEMTQSLLQANPALREGDQLSFIRFTQMTNASTGVPFVIVRKYEVILNSTDLRRFYDFMPVEYISWNYQAGTEYIRVDDSGNAGGFVVILSRTVGGKTYVSTQDIIVANNDLMINTYSTEAALQTAIDSYGDSAEPFLTSTAAEVDNQAATRPSVVNVEIENTNYSPGQRAVVPRFGTGAYIRLNMSQDMAGAELNAINIRAYRGGQLINATASDLQVYQNTLSGLIATTGEPGEAVLYDVQADTSEGWFRAVFLVTNADTIGGLE